MRKSRSAAAAAREEEFRRTEVAGNHAVSRREVEKLADRRRAVKTQRARARDAKVPTRQS